MGKQFVQKVQQDIHFVRLIEQSKPHQARIKQMGLLDLFDQDAERFHRFSRSCPTLGVLFDFSKQRIDQEILNLLLQFCRDSGLQESIEALFEGSPLNVSEGRPALHMRLREPHPAFKIAQELEKIKAFVGQARSRFTDVVALGIGGSELGPLLLSQALRGHTEAGLKVHFVSNLDGLTLTQLLGRLDPKKTLGIISSKTFSTLETLLNAEVLKNLLPRDQLCAVTAHPVKALDWGIQPDCIFEFWEEVGGRYSIWSAIALPAILILGSECFQAFLSGAHAVDQHFLNTPNHEQNIPVLMSLIDIWNRNVLGYNTHAIVPYNDGLDKLPDYLQQLEMESHGKSVLRTQEKRCPYDTGAVLWGGVGCNGQHAFMQFLHQNSEVVPVDFIAAVGEDHPYPEHQAHLLASLLAQSRALMVGNQSSSLQHTCCGGKPSSVFLLEKLSPYHLGVLLALYEHKVFVSAMLWGINPFDQWGVELGKRLTVALRPLLKLAASQQNPAESAGEQSERWDGSTLGLVDYINDLN